MRATRLYLPPLGSRFVNWVAAAALSAYGGHARVCLAVLSLCTPTTPSTQPVLLRQPCGAHSHRRVAGLPARA